MHFFSLFVALWMGFVSLFGFGAHTPPHASSTSTSTSSTAITTSTRSASSDINTTRASATSSSQPSRSNTPSAVSSPSTTTLTVDIKGLPATGSPWQTSLPLGDYHYTTATPQKGYIYLCNIASNGGGAQGKTDWIHGSTWDPLQKVSVEGAVSWPNATYTMSIANGIRHITSNGLPTDHPTGIFPIKPTDPSYQFDKNPNSIEPQHYSFSLPVHPTMLAAPECIHNEVGIMNDGVPLFDGFDADYRDAVAHETQDAWDGHPDGSDVYHYHGFEDSVMKDTPVTTVVGFAFDGYPITGGKLPNGTYLTTSQLDVCHGITSTIQLDGKWVTMYHYVLTQDFPYSVSCFHAKSYEPKPNVAARTHSATSSTEGTPNTTSATTSGTASSQAGAPPAAISACASATAGTSCSFATLHGTVSGTCKTPPSQSSLACVPG